MKDIGTTPQTASPERDVIARLVARLQWDADVAYLLGPGTETHGLLLRAVQHIHGLDETQARDLLKHRSGERSRLVTLHQRINALEVLLDERCPDWREEDSDAG